jgi:hypothetical protein
MRAVLIGIGLLCGTWAIAATDDAVVPYPAGYRKWVHVKSTVIGPEHPRYASNGGIHHFYANEKAMEGYSSGKFPDGAVLVDDLLEIIKGSDGVSSEGARRRVAVMVKGGARYRDTGGWGFEIFKGDESAPALNAEGKAACFACHGMQKEHDLVFSQFRK